MGTLHLLNLLSYNKTKITYTYIKNVYITFWDLYSSSNLYNIAFIK